MEIVFEATSKTDLLNSLDHIAMDVILVDMEEREQSELAFLHAVLESPNDVKVIALIECNHTSDIGIKNRMLEIIKLGVKGFQCKHDMTAGEFVHAVRTVHTGGMCLASCVAQVLLDNEIPQQTRPLATLSNRETEVLQLVAMGKSNSEIADKLFISICTVKCHVSSILTKLKVKNRTQASLLML